jgi:hypothetical protein
VVLGPTFFLKITHMPVSSDDIVWKSRMKIQQLQDQFDWQRLQELYAKLENQATNGQMTKLEEEILLAINKGDKWNEDTDIGGHMAAWEKELAKAAAEVAKRYIEKAYDAGLGRSHLYQGQKKTKEQWLKDNGIV